MSNVMINNINIYYEVYGEGEPILLIAGLASDSQSWLPVIGELSKHYQVIVFDNRCVGRTIQEDLDITIEDLSNDCIGLIKHLHLSSIMMVGHSMGGFIALNCAIKYPQYVSKLILAGTSAVNSQRNNELFSDFVYHKVSMKETYWYRNLFFWLFTDDFFKDKKTLDGAVQIAIEYPNRQSAKNFKKQVMAIADFDCSNELPLINKPTLIIYGKEDLLFPYEKNSNLLKKIPDSKCCVIDGAAHSIHMEKPTEFVNCILKF